MLKWMRARLAAQRRTGNALDNLQPAKAGVGGGTGSGASALFADAGIPSLYLWIGFVVAPMLAFLTPPFWIPDELDHFLRAFQLSEFGLRGFVKDGAAGAVLPASLWEMALHFVDQSREAKPFSVRETLALFSIPLDAERRGFLDLTFAANRPPLAYLPQTLAIYAGRACDMGPLGLLYAARLANAAASLAIAALALRALPVGKATLFCFALLPMALILFASASPDALTIATAFLFTAIAARAAYRQAWHWRDVATACAAGAVFCMQKPVYAPLLALGFPASLRRGAALRVGVVHAAILVVALGCAAIWLSYAASIAADPKEGTNPAAQTAHLMAHPFQFAGTFFNSFLAYGAEWARGFIGLLGTSVQMPFVMYIVPFFALAASVLAARAPQTRPTGLEIGWYVLLMGAASVLTLIALYIGWTPVGAGVVEGIQGRYFLPLAALMAVCLSRLPSQTGVAGEKLRVAAIGLAAAEAGLTPLVEAVFFWTR